MSDVRLVARGSGKESFVVTREQISELIDNAYELGQEDGFKPRAFECECDALRLNDWSGQQVARAKRLHIVTANHLREERRRRRKAELVAKNNIEAVRNFLGCEDWASIDVTPRHYQGDTWVTCRRALESCQRQPRVTLPTHMAFYWWACAFKYVWRCWSKADPEADMRKAIDCLRKAMGELPGCARQVAHRRVEWDGVPREESNG